MKSKCSRCGCELDRIAYVEPDWSGQPRPGPRPPLCKDCWRIADEQAAIEKGERT